MRRNSGLIGQKKNTDLTSASGTHDTFDNYNARIGNNWPKVKKLVSISPNSGNHFEGETKTITVYTDGYQDGNTVYYTIAAVTGTVNAVDFENFSGSFTVNSSGVGTFNVQVYRDNSSETESYKIQIRDGSTSGSIIGESETFTIPDPTYDLSTTSSSVNEGDTLSVRVATTNVYTGTHYYSVSHGGTNSNDFTTNTEGSLYIQSNLTIFNLAITEDFLSEGSETFTIYIRVDSTYGMIVAQKTITINDTSQTVSATCTPNVSSIGEGFGVTFTVNTTNFASGTLNWEAVLSADMEDNDISATSGTVNISGSTGTISITATADGYTETGQTESFQIKIFDPNGNAMVTSSAVTINDLSTGTPEPSGIDITTSFYEISNRFIDSGAYMGSSIDYTGPYDVGEVQTNFSGSGRVYIGVKVTAQTTFYNDIPIAGVQIISGSTLVASWIFNTSTGGSGSGWQTYTNQIYGTSTQGFPATPATVSAYGYVNLSTSTSTSRFCWRSNTGSSYTGAADGIGNTYKLSANGGSNTLATVGDAQISQTSNTYYAYRETSGSTRWSGTVMRSPTYTFSGGEKIRVIHAVTGYSGTPMDPDDSVYVAVY